MSRSDRGAVASACLSVWLVLSFLPTLYCLFQAVTCVTFEVSSTAFHSELAPHAYRVAMYLGAVVCAATYVVFNGIAVAISRAAGLESGGPVWLFLVLLLGGVAGCVAEPFSFARQTRLALEDWRQRAEPVVAAVRHYTADQGQPPADLNALVPDYIGSLPPLHLAGAWFEYRCNRPTWWYGCDLPRKAEHGRTYDLALVRLAFSSDGHVVAAEAEPGSLPPSGRTHDQAVDLADAYLQRKLVGLTREEVRARYGKPNREVASYAPGWSFRLITATWPNDALYLAAHMKTAEAEAQPGITHHSVEHWGDWLHCRAGLGALQDIKEAAPDSPRPKSARPVKPAGRG